MNDPSLQLQSLQIVVYPLQALGVGIDGDDTG